MINRTFSIYDSKAETFSAPFYEKTVGLATRAFQDACNIPDHPFNKHPNDYTLFELGSFNTNTGLHDDHKTPISLGLAVQYLIPVELQIVEDAVQTPVEEAS